MNNYEFKLTPAYCLYNGVAVLEQEGTYIKLLIENDKDELLKARIRRAFTNHIELLQKQKNCPEEFRRIVEVRFERGNRSQLKKCVMQLFKADSIAVKKSSDEEIERNKKDVAAVLLLDSILSDARSKKATDIHIEENCIKFRIKGRLEKELEIQSEKSLELVQRIKLLGGMNVIEKRKSQDGHFVYGNTNPIFVRVSSVSIVGNDSEIGESVVMRLLDTSRIPLALGELGFNGLQLEQIEKLFEMKNGLVLVCGPTGSGKSTTLASMLIEIGKNGNGAQKIISLEDPPEYKIPNVTQIKIDEINTFKNCLSHIFRQDPDVIMIGEIRDEESAEVALRAALTGHLVFATLHTGSAGEAVLRLQNLGLDRNLLSSVLRGIICQELSFVNEKSCLYADVSIPCLLEEKNDAKTEDEINELFEHFTNYPDIIAATVEGLSEENSEDALVREASGEEESDVEMSAEEEMESLERPRKRKIHPYYKGDYKGGLENEGVYGRAI